MFGLDGKTEYVFIVKAVDNHSNEMFVDKVFRERDDADSYITKEKAQDLNNEFTFSLVVRKIS